MLLEQGDSTVMSIVRNHDRERDVECCCVQAGVKFQGSVFESQNILTVVSEVRVVLHNSDYRKADFYSTKAKSFA